MKKIILVFILVMVVINFICCNNKSSSDLKIGMITDVGTIDDKCFNESAWNGIVKASEDLEVESCYIKPEGETDKDYLSAINNLYEKGINLIVAPGYKFEESIYKAQEKYENINFIIIDGIPRYNEESVLVGENTISVLFKEEQAAFLAAVASAIEMKEGDFGFIGGENVEVVENFNVGFKQGIEYANNNYGTNITYLDEYHKYVDSFENEELGKSLASSLYDNGVNVIFTVAGKTGIGVIEEAKNRALKGENVWVVGVDVDQYNDGIYDISTNKSVVLTSAIKRSDEVIYNIIKDKNNGKFDGGQVVDFGIVDGAVGIPEKNINLSEETQSKVNEIYDSLEKGKIEIRME